MTLKKAADLVATAKARVENLSPEQVAKELENGVVLIDLREPEEGTKEGTIKGAVNIPRGMIEFRADPSSPYHDKAFDPSRRIILHCASSGRSALAAVTLKEMGYPDVAHLDGGFKAWKESGRPVA